MTGFRHWAVIAAVLLVAPGRGVAGGSPYFPDRGRGAVHQQALDLLNPATVLYVAFQPGSEDLTSLAFLRLGSGARVTVVYLTSGEATPSDLSGEVPYLLAGRRKDEALRACRYLGCSPYFLNLPDPGILPDDDTTLAKVWDADTVSARLRPVLNAFKPDVVILGFDPRRARQTPTTLTYISQVLLKALHLPGEPWQVERLFVERAEAGSLKVEGGGIHPVWKKSYRAIAEEAGKFYASLCAQRTRWAELRPGEYALIRPAKRSAPPTFTSGFPVLSARMKGVEPAILLAAGAKKGGGKTPVLREVSAGIDSLERFLRSGARSLSAGEARLVSAWRNSLEALRCALLDVRVSYECSDSLLSSRQLFFVRIKDVKARASTAPLEIIFPPASQSPEAGWVINEAKKSRFPLASPAEFRILTPEKLEFNYPTSAHGLLRNEIRLPFSFIVFHTDPVREHNFAYKAEMEFGIGPKRAFEVRSPIVRALPGEPIVYSFLNFSRDAFNGQIGIVDTLLPEVLRKSVRLTGKDHLLVDTLFLPPTTSLPEGDYLFSLSISGGGGRWPVVARSFDVRVDSTARAGLVTGIHSSPVREALRRMRIPFREINPDAHTTGIDSLAVIILDREALTLRKGSADLLPALRDWVRRGGHLIVFPQFLHRQGEFPFAGLAQFDDRAPLAPASPVAIDTTHPFLGKPNRLGEDDWGGWVVARSFGSLKAETVEVLEVPVRSRETGDPLLLTGKSGGGRVTFIALDLMSQLANVAPGAHRLLANILAAH